MIVYGSSVSPFVRKVRAFAAEKGLELRLAPPQEDPEGFREASPFGKIPAFRDGDFLISDSSAIVAYLDAKFPEDPLIPADPRDRARAIWFDEYADTIVQEAVAKVFYHRVAAPLFYGKPGKPEVADQVEREVFPRLAAYLERSVTDSGFLVAGQLTLADIAVASAFASLAEGDCRPDPARYPRAAAWLAAMWARPVFAALLAEEEALLASMAPR
ncbi:glutathione S-transferase family protein [Novosphingobium bradum]|uniref:Glutathione S-transferase family protein n=1 Tax=Novosphingobium bradum TaxID=1737444 RepID=A0ABV7IPD3_9SPHN